MGTETFRPAGPSFLAQSQVSGTATVRRPASFQVATQLMEDAVPAAGLSRYYGRRNQVALFANPFKQGAEEALVIDGGLRLTYVRRDETSSTGWSQQVVDGTPPVSEVVAAVLPSGNIWAVCLPLAGADWTFLRLEESETAEGEESWTWTVQSDPVVPSKPPLSTFGLQLSYTPDGDPTIVGLSPLPASNSYAATFLSVAFGPTTGTTEEEKWRLHQVQFSTDLVNFELRGGGYVPVLSAASSPHYVLYLWNPVQFVLRRVDLLGTSFSSVSNIPLSGPHEFCGTWNVPALPQYDQQSDMGWVTLSTDGDLEFWYAAGPLTARKSVRASSVSTPFVVRNSEWQEAVSVWQDVNGLMHVFGMDYRDVLCVLHQQGWGKPPQAGDSSCGPIWARALTQGGSEITVVVGVRDDVSSFLLDPYPDYKTTEWIEMAEHVLLSERYCVCTQDVTTDRWATENIRLASPGAPHLISHYSADTTLVDGGGTPMPDYPVTISADTLTQITVDAKAFQVSPGRTASLRTNALGKLCISVVADDLTPPVVNVNTDGLEAGVLIDFASQVNSYLAGQGPLPSQTAPLSVATLDAARTTDNEGVQQDLMNEVWRDFTAAQKQGFVDLVRNLYAMPGGGTPALALAGCEEPREVAGCTFQVWDKDRPVFEVFRTEKEMAKHRAHVENHPGYQGLREWFDGANDVWEGIKSGATRIVGVTVTGNSQVSIAYDVNGAVVSLPAVTIATVGQAAQVVAAAFQMVSDAVVRVIGWLRSPLGLSAVWDTKLALEQGLNSGLSMFGTLLGDVGTLPRDWFKDRILEVYFFLEKLEQQYAGTCLGDFPNKVPPSRFPTGTGFGAQDLGVPQADWFLNRMLALTDATPLTYPPDPGIESVTAPLDSLFSSLAQSSQFTALADSFTARTKDLAGLLASTGPLPRYEYVRLLDVTRNLAPALLEALDTNVGDFRTFAKDAMVNSLTKLLGRPIPGGMTSVDTLYQWVWKQARPLEIPKPATIGGLITLTAAFYVTAVYRLANGADTAPFPKGQYPVVPPPSSAAGDEGTALTPEQYLQLQCTGLAHTVLARVAGAYSGMAVPWAAGVTGKEAWPTIGNYLHCASGLLGWLQGMPPVTGTDWSRATGAPWAIGGLRWGFDVVLSVAGPYWSASGRSTLLKNVGFDWDAASKTLKKSDSILIGSMADYALSSVVTAFDVFNAFYGASTTDTTNPALWGLRTASFASAYASGLLSPVRAAFQEPGPVDATRLVGLASVTGTNAVLDLGSVLCVRIPPYVELANRPTFPDQKPKLAIVNMPYMWTIESTVATEPVNARPASSPQRYRLAPQDDIHPFTFDEVSGEISCHPMIPPNSPRLVTFHVTGEDGYGPPLSATTEFTIEIQGIPPREKAGRRRRPERR